jgi:hypothetical protein
MRYPYSSIIGLLLQDENVADSLHRSASLGFARAACSGRVTADRRICVRRDKSESSDVESPFFPYRKHMVEEFAPL